MGEGEFFSRCPSRDKGADEFWVDFIDLEVDGMVSLQEIGHRSERLRDSAQQDLRSAQAILSPFGAQSLQCFFQRQHYTM